MPINEALRIIIRNLGDIRVPVLEEEIHHQIISCIHDLFECVKVLESENKPEESGEDGKVPEGTEPEQEVKENV